MAPIDVCRINVAIKNNFVRCLEAIRVFDDDSDSEKFCIFFSSVQETHNYCWEFCNPHT